ncbi:MAG: antibiotic biosynthesis monooxygenase [Coxiellaceae bacterium]|nr:antibiotic biosynthesis monooxygenase [Coxiellaceae bacterium]
MTKNKQEPKITCHVKFIAKPGMVNQLLDHLQQTGKSTREQDSCEYHEVLQSLDNPNEITIIEKFTNHDAFVQHTNDSAIQHFVLTEKDNLVDSMHSHLFITRMDEEGSVSNIDAADVSWK